MTIKSPKRIITIFAAIALIIFSAGCDTVSAESSPSSQASLAPAVESSTAEHVKVQEEVVINMTARHISGEAYVLRGSEKFSLSIDDVLLEGDIIITGTDSMAVLNQKGGKQIWIAADSLLELTSLTGDEDGEKTTLTLNDGNVISVIDEKLGAGDSYDVETPGLVMAIRGTIASVSYDAKAEESSAAFFEGSGIVESKSKDDIVVASLGERVTVADGGLERDIVTIGTINESERRFLFDEEYGEQNDRENLDKRLEALLDKQEFNDSTQSAPSSAPSQTETTPLPEQRQNDDNTAVQEDPIQESTGQTSETSTVSGSNDFFTIKQEYIQAQKDYGQGKISKDEFLAIKQKFLEAKAAYNGRY